MERIGVRAVKLSRSSTVTVIGVQPSSHSQVEQRVGGDRVVDVADVKLAQRLTGQTVRADQRAARANNADHLG